MDKMNNGDFFNQVELNNLHRYAYALCTNQDDTYDLLHYALEKYLNKPEIAESAGHNSARNLAYVRSIMRNHFIDECRKSARFPEQGYDDNLLVVIDETSLEDTVIAQLDLVIIWKEFSAVEKEILYYSAVTGMTAQEIADQTATPRGTVLSRLYRLRKKFGARSEEN